MDVVLVGFREDDVGITGGLVVGYCGMVGNGVGTFGILPVMGDVGGRSKIFVGFGAVGFAELVVVVGGWMGVQVQLRLWETIAMAMGQNSSGIIPDSADL